MSSDTKFWIFGIIGFLLLLSMCDGGGSGNPYEYPDNCIQGPYGYDC
jgi:hypothetical protein